MYKLFFLVWMMGMLVAVGSAEARDLTCKAMTCKCGACNACFNDKEKKACEKLHKENADAENSDSEEVMEPSSPDNPHGREEF